MTKLGNEALEYYKETAATAFQFLPAVAVVIYLSPADESAGLLSFPLTLGPTFSILLAAAWLIGAKWFGPGK